MEWNNTQEENLRTYGENAKVYKWLHRKMNVDLLSWDKWIGIATILAGFGTGTTSFTKIISENDDLNIAITISGLVSGILTSLNHFLKLKEQAINHNNIAKKYNNLALDIEFTLSLKRNDRGDPLKYMKEIKERLSSLDSESPDISKSILTEFDKKFKNSKILKPDLVGELDKIEKASSDNSDIEQPVVIDISLQETFKKMKETQVGSI